MLFLVLCHFLPLRSLLKYVASAMCLRVTA